MENNSLPNKLKHSIESSSEHKIRRAPSHWKKGKVFSACRVALELQGIQVDPKI